MGEIQGDGMKHPYYMVLSFNQIWSLELPNFLCKTLKFCAQEGDRANRCGGNILESQKLLDWKEPWEAVAFNLPLRAKSALTLVKVSWGHAQSSSVYLQGWETYSSFITFTW